MIMMMTKTGHSSQGRFDRRGDGGGVHSLGGGVAGQGGRVVVRQLLKVVRFIIGTIGKLFT